MLTKGKYDNVRRHGIEEGKGELTCTNGFKVSGRDRNRGHNSLKHPAPPFNVDQRKTFWCQKQH